MVVRIIHLDENGNLLEEDKRTRQENRSSEETTDKENKYTLMRQLAGELK